MTSRDLSERFACYDSFLHEQGGYWQLSAFAQSKWPWAESQATIMAKLTAQLASLPEITLANSLKLTKQHIPFWLSNGIQGRKLAQIGGFTELFSSQHNIIEWCAGKGHLGRILSFHYQRSVTSMEYQSTLCQQGQQLADRFELQQQFIHADVMHLPAGWLPNDCAVIALHACGDLHRRLLEQALQTAHCELFVAPCCYHLQAYEHYRPLSQQGQQSNLRISREQLKFAVQEQVTGGQRIASLRDKEQLWRLVFDIYRAQCTGLHDYQPLPSVAKHWFSGELHEFVRWACQQQQLTCPSNTQLETLLPLAQRRLELVRSIDSVKQLLRQPFECWLLLDRALMLAEQGFDVTLREFCQRQHSPRNVMIIAKR